MQAICTKVVENPSLAVISCIRAGIAEHGFGAISGTTGLGRQAADPSLIQSHNQRIQDSTVGIRRAWIERNVTAATARKINARPNDCQAGIARCQYTVTSPPPVAKPAHHNGQTWTT